jgi:hypothetical protein
VGTSDRIAIFRFADSYRTKKKQSEYWSSKAIRLQISDKQSWTSDSPIAIGLAEIYQTKKGNFYSFSLYFITKFCRSGEFFANFSDFCENSGVVGISTVFGISAAWLLLLGSLLLLVCLLMSVFLMLL